ncbi:unnamed protein product [Caenorhabditis angaria]|uniref:Uncharacterized protein n=1 Tax=Caenorhabditis angaria TaxID=860376 RepID=A0A9P1MXD7_9PELO|nr:unnamed protein product [Caenorhabditis angaria]
MLKDYDEFEELIYYPNEELKDLLENKIFQVALNSPGLIFFAIFTWKIYLNNEILMENRTRLIMIEMWLINFLTILDLVINAIYEADTYFMDSEGIIRSEINWLVEEAENFRGLYLEIAIFLHISREIIHKKYSDLPTYPNIVIFIAQLYFSYCFGQTFRNCNSIAPLKTVEQHKDRYLLHPILLVYFIISIKYLGLKFYPNSFIIPILFTFFIRSFFEKVKINYLNFGCQTNTFLYFMFIPIYASYSEIVFRKLFKRFKEFITRCTPVPSCESTLLENEANRKIVIISSEKEAESGSENDLTLSSNCCLDSSLYFQYCIPIHIFFMQRRIGSTEMTSDEKLRLPLKYMIRKVGTKIKNRFSFYVFASIFEIRWNRAKNAMMKKARDSNNIFRKLLAPNSVDLSLVDLMKLMELDEIPNNLNLYVFIRNVDEMELLDSPDSNAWRFDHVLESGK